MTKYQDYLQEIYSNRFKINLKERNKVWSILCSDFFQKYIPRNSKILEIAAGYCEFINNINAKEKIALDLNKDVKKFAKSEVKVHIGTATKLDFLEKESIDVVFISNFFEHLTKIQIVETLKEVHRILRKGGKILILQPNIRYCYKDYWMFFDHISPLDHRSLKEILLLQNFKIQKILPRFLPFQMKESKLPKFKFLIKIFLKCKIAQIILGKQMFIYAKK